MDTARLKQVAAPVPRATHTRRMNKTEAVRSRWSIMNPKMTRAIPDVETFERSARQARSFASAITANRIAARTRLPSASTFFQRRGARRLL